MLYRALTVGIPTGLVLGLLSYLDSGFVITGAIVFVVVGSFYGIWMTRRMARYWPESEGLSGDERVTVVSAARRGKRVDAERLAGPLVAYVQGLHAATEKAGKWRWLIVAVLVVAAGTAIWDGVYGSWGSLIASIIYLAAVVVELFWWPSWLAGLLANADRAAELAGEHHAEPER